MVTDLRLETKVTCVHVETNKLGKNIKLNVTVTCVFYFEVPCLRNITH